MSYTATSASDRYEEARAARVAWLDGSMPMDESASRMAAALRVLIEPAQTNLTIPEIAESALRKCKPPFLDSDGHWCYPPLELVEVAATLVGAGIQAAWEDWEPENAPGVPSPESEKLEAIETWRRTSGADLILPRLDAILGIDANDEGLGR